MDKEQLKRVLEALIFASDSPLSVKQMLTILPDIDQTDIELALTELANELSDRAIYLKKSGGGYVFGTRPEYAEWIGQMFQEKHNSRLSRAALETLAIIAFKQPISRVEVSAIRGVNSDGVMKKLLDFRLITISGRDSGPGRPLLFKTTPEFLNYFGINDISELPRPKEVEELLADGEGGEILQSIPDELLIVDGPGTISDDEESENTENADELKSHEAEAEGDETSIDEETNTSDSDDQPAEDFEHESASDEFDDAAPTDYEDEKTS